MRNILFALLFVCSLLFSSCTLNENANKKTEQKAQAVSVDTTKKVSKGLIFVTSSNDKTIVKRQQTIQDSIINVDVAPYAWGDIKFGCTIQQLKKHPFLKGLKYSIYEGDDLSIFGTTLKVAKFGVGDALGLENSFGDFTFYFKLNSLYRVTIEGLKSTGDGENDISKTIRSLRKDCEILANQFRVKMGEPTWDNSKSSKNEGIIYSFEAGKKSVYIGIYVNYDAKRKHKHYISVSIENESVLDKSKLQELEDAKKKEELKKEEEKKRKNKEILKNSF